MPESVARRLFQLVEPVAVVTYMADEPTGAVMALGLRNMWDAYFAGRAAPLGRDVPAAVVHALFYNFADGEVARHIPRVWDMVTPASAIAAQTGERPWPVAALRTRTGLSAT
ncbi:MAG: helix-turn-helix domain-containing protein, partial [Gemmatimonadales bacterium]